MKRFALLLIRFYQKIISPVLPGACRFHPSCSEYTRQAFETYNIPKALWLSSKRISRCNPLSDGFFDPLPVNNQKGINNGRQTK